MLRVQLVACWTVGWWMEVLERQTFGAIRKLKLAQWLAEQEELHQVVLYLADPIKSLWTFRCIRQADLMLFVIIPDVEEDVDLGVLGKWVSESGRRVGARKNWCSCTTPSIIHHSREHKCWSSRAAIYSDYIMSLCLI